MIRRDSMRILLTGGAGFIGSHIADIYVRNGHEVVIIDNLSNGMKANVPDGVKLIVGDIADTSLIKSIIKDFKPDIINHQAAQIDVVKSIENPILDIDINVKASVNLIKIAKEYGVKRFIFASSGGAIYGDVPEGIVPDEDYLPRPMNPYGADKLTVDMYLTFMGLSYVSLRYANIYGPRQGLGGEAGVIGKFISRAIRGEPLYIFGDGYQTRDYTYVGDVATANLLALDNLPDGIYNVSTGQETNLWQIVDAIRKEIPDIKVEEKEPRPGDVRRSVMSSKKLQRYGWRPMVSLREGIHRTVQWWSKNA